MLSRVLTLYPQLPPQCLPYRHRRKLRRLLLALKSLITEIGKKVTLHGLYWTVKSMANLNSSAVKAVLWSIISYSCAWVVQRVHNQQRHSSSLWSRSSYMTIKILPILTILTYNPNDPIYPNVPSPPPVLGDRLLPEDNQHWQVQWLRHLGAVWVSGERRAGVR